MTATFLGARAELNECSLLAPREEKTSRGARGLHCYVAIVVEVARFSECGEGCENFFDAVDAGFGEVRHMRDLWVYFSRCPVVRARRTFSVLWLNSLAVRAILRVPASEAGRR
jgi:hypothetical protein